MKRIACFSCRVAHIQVCCFFLTSSPRWCRRKGILWGSCPFRIGCKKIAREKRNGFALLPSPVRLGLQPAIMWRTLANDEMLHWRKWCCGKTGSRTLDAHSIEQEIWCVYLCGSERKYGHSFRLVSAIGQTPVSHSVCWYMGVWYVMYCFVSLTWP